MEPIKIDITILSPIDKVWKLFNDPKHITKWNFAHETWHCPKAENDLKVGGKFSYYMQARDKSFGFDFEGIYDEVENEKYLKYHLDDQRKVEVIFEKIDDGTTKVTQIFDPEKQNSLQMQRNGWYDILNNFHKYVENYKG